jgi:4-alpha-glucanotransferase
MSIATTMPRPETALLTSQVRASGIILHPTSLPGRFGIGDLGPEAYRFVDFLAATGQQIWQLLPLGPTHAEEWHSPYSALSAFAGNPLLLSMELIHDQGLLDTSALADAAAPADDAVDFARVVELKERLLAQASANFQIRASAALRDQLAQFCRSASAWLDDYSLFMALRQEQGPNWVHWEDRFRHREPATLDAARKRLAPAIFCHKYIQFEFERQWSLLKHHANSRGVQILGDLPFYVSANSADVWAQPELFQLSPTTLQPVVEAGVPPEIFCADGQHWGNPVYDWQRLAQDDYKWWAERLKQSFHLYDFVRVDHFRAFEAYWTIPRGAAPKSGQWVKGPGADFFNAMLRHLPNLPELPITAEDIGGITPEVQALREQFGFPSMFVLHFAFDGNIDNPYLPFRCRSGFVCYTGTHDTNTSIGWYRGLGDAERKLWHDYIGAPSSMGMQWDMIRLAWASVAKWAIAPLQDILGLGGEARMNSPGTAIAANWRWRFRWESLSDVDCGRLTHLTKLYGRAPAGLH